MMSAAATKSALIALVITTNVVIAQQPIPIRELGAPEATSVSTVGYLNGVRHLSDGRVLVNEAGKRRLLLFDKTLANVRVVADTSAGSKVSYGLRPSTIIPYLGDSTLFVDLPGRAFLVLDGEGVAARVMSLPRANDLFALSGSAPGAPRFDRAGRLIYRSTLPLLFKAPVVGKPYTPPVIADSAPLLRADFDTRVADTIAWLRVAKIKVNTTFLPNGGVTLTPIVAPIATIDDWTALADGSVAVLRGSDYHIDWINADGSRTSSPKMPFDWKRLTDEEKVAMIDSTRKAMILQAESGGGASNGPGAPVPGGHGGPPSSSPAGHSMTIMPIGGADGAAAPQSSAKASTSPAVAEVVPASDLPDYMPPVLQSGIMKADFEGNVWVLPSTSAQSGRGLLYDVINRNGEIIRRVRLPEGRALQGFGPGVVYLTSHGPAGARLERVRIE